MTATLSRRFRAVFTFTILSLSLSSALSSSIASAGIQEDFTATMDLIQSNFKERYGNEENKQRLYRWTIDGQMKELRARAKAKGSNLTLIGAQELATEFFKSTRDYHVGIYGEDWGGKQLPIRLVLNGKKAYVTAIGAGASVGEMRVGDEVLSFDGESVVNAIQKWQTPKRYSANAGYETRDAVNWLTRRYIAMGTPQPTKPAATLVLRRAGSTPSFTVNVNWDAIPVALSETTGREYYRNVSKTFQDLTLEEGRMNDVPTTSNPFGSGGAYSYFTPPEEVIWQNDPKTAIFHAWITKLPDGRRLGTIRIPNFSPGSTPAEYKAAVDLFEPLVAKMNTETDVLVLDLLSNSGGMLDYAYALASYFFDRPTKAYAFQYRLLPAFVEEAKKDYPILKAIKTEAEVKAYFEGDHYYGFPVDLQFVRDMEHFIHGFIEGADAGAKFGPKRHYNAATIKPNPRVRYLKPVFVLADEASVSCGDFFPAFFQDNKRAKILGRRTAGAGAFVGGTMTVPNPLGLSMMRIPFAPGYRYDGKLIEDFGVAPDKWLDVSDSDFSSNFTAFRTKVFAEIAKSTSR